MAGKKITRLRQMLTECVKIAEEAKGTADEPFANNRVAAVKEELVAEEEHRAKFGKKPGAPSAWKTTQGPCTERKQKFEAKRKSAARLVGQPAIGHPKSTGLDAIAGIAATEIAIAGVPKDFATVKPGDPLPLTDTEFANARDIVATVADENESRLLTDGTMTHECWLEEAFPALTPNRRVKCGRFLSNMATMAADKPGDDSPDGMTVIENALRASGMSYVEFENAHQMDHRFADAQEAIKAARKRCIMDRLEETLQNRALFGQVEETVDRFGQHNEVRRIDNRLAFDLLKYGHEKYLKQNIQDKAAAGVMTMMIAQSHFAPPVAKEPKQAEVIDVQ